jgi:formate dehydrogenase alpha subunit
MTNSIDEIKNVGCLFVIGSNTTENHPVVSLEMKEAVRAYGAKLIVADPRRIDLVDYADVWLSQKPGTDVALINGLMHVIIREELHDQEFIAERTEDFEKLADVVKAYTPETVERITGVPEKDLEKAALLFAEAKAGGIFYAMGITQHTTGTDNVKALANLAMVTGNVGKESGGVNPLRGQNNVQGACDMGALPNVFPGYQPVTDERVREKFEAAWSQKLPSQVGLTIIEMMNAAVEGKLKALYIMGEDPLTSDPNISHVKEGIEKLEFLVVQDIFLSEVAKYAHVVLPGTSFAEKEGTFTNTERRVQRVRKAIQPPGTALPDWKIILELFKRMGKKQNCSTPEKVMGEISQLTPQYGGILYKRIEKEGIQWPCPDITHPGTKYLHKERFARGKGKFFPIKFINPHELTDNEYPFILTTGRVLYHWHGGNMSRHSQGLKEIYPEGLVEIHPQEAASIGCEDGDRVMVESRRGRITGKVKVTRKTSPGIIFMTFHFPEILTNVLTNDALDPIAKIPEYKVCAVRVKKVA